MPDAPHPNSEPSTPPKNRRVIVVPYDPNWPQAFRAEHALIEACLSPLPITIHHIGSTSVPGLDAKPIIDILIETDDITTLNHNPLAEIGYEAWGEYHIPGRRYFTKGGPDLRSHQIHAFAKADPNVHRHIAFRDYLRAHPNITAKYAAIKREGAAKANRDIDRYMDHKDAFIKQTEADALAWADAHPNAR